MKPIIVTEYINTYQNYSKLFHIYTDALEYPVGAATIQEGKLVAYFSQKLKSVQMSYSTTKEKLLTIILCLKEYCKVLFRGQITVYTYHQNLTFKTLSVQRILHWRIFMDEFDLRFKYIKGKDNVLADCFSQLPILQSISDENKNPKIIAKREQSRKFADFDNYMYLRMTK